MATGHRRLGQRDEALTVCQQGRALYPDDVELLYQEGLLLYEKGELPGAVEALRRLLAVRPGPYFAIGVDAGLPVT